MNEAVNISSLFISSSFALMQKKQKIKAYEKKLKIFITG